MRFSRKEKVLVTLVFATFGALMGFGIWWFEPLSTLLESVIIGIIAGLVTMFFFYADALID